MLEELRLVEDSAWLLFVGLLLLFFAASEVGFRLARRGADRVTAEQKTQVNTVLAALLGLFALLLAFSFQIVESRFQARKTLVLQEANAIGTTYLRTDFLPEPQRERTRALLRRYVDVRLEAVDFENLHELIPESEQIHDALWSRAAEAARAAPRSVPLGLYIDSLNHLIDLHEMRVTVALRNRLPKTIVWMLLFVAVLGSGLLGYSSGFTRSRNLLANVALILALSGVILLVLDLDRPNQRMFNVSQAALQDLRETLARDTRG